MREGKTHFTRSPPVDPGPLYDLINRSERGLREFSAISAAVELGIFDLCTEEKNAREIATMIPGKPHLCGLLCEALCDSGLLQKNGDLFINSPLASTFLTRESSYSHTGYILHLAKMGHDLWGPLAEVIRNGPVAYPREEFFRDSSLPAMAETSLSGRLQEIIRTITRLPGFDQMKRVLDLGGGHGLYAIALTLENPDLDAYVFDLPHVVEGAARYIREYGADRVHLIPGNFFEDPIGEHYDIILSSSNPSGKSEELIRTISEALNDGGWFVNVQSTGMASPDPYQALEWQLWTFEGVDKKQGGFTKEQPFMTESYRRKMAGHSLVIVEERDIRDLYHADTWVRMVVAQKQLAAR